MQKKYKARTDILLHRLFEATISLREITLMKIENGTVDTHFGETITTITAGTKRKSSLDYHRPVS